MDKLKLMLVANNLVDTDVPYLYVRALANNLLMDFDYDTDACVSFCNYTVVDGFSYVNVDVQNCTLDDLRKLDAGFLNGVYVMLKVVDLLLYDEVI